MSFTKFWSCVLEKRNEGGFVLGFLIFFCQIFAGSGKGAMAGNLEEFGVGFQIKARIGQKRI